MNGLAGIFSVCVLLQLINDNTLVIKFFSGFAANGEVNEEDPDGLMRKLRAL